MRTSKASFLYVFLFLIIHNSSLNAQLIWNIYTEGGLFKLISRDNLNPRDLLLRLDANLNYRYANDDMSASAKIKVRPECYGFENNLRALKLKASGDYYQKNKTVSWGVAITGQKNFYKNSMTNFDYTIFILSFSTNWYELEDYAISSQIGYAYQTASENIEQNLDLLFLDLKIFKSLFPYNNSSLGVYIERFTIDNKYLSLLDNSVNTNKGMRYGPQIRFNYLEKTLINFEYRFLFHSSQITQYPSYEHWIRFVAGKILTERWSVFILADYYNRRYTLKGEKSITDFLLYNPLDNENKINIKLAYEVYNNLEVYLKTGYFKENFFDSRFNFEGWNILFGLEVSK